MRSRFRPLISRFATCLVVVGAVAVAQARPAPADVPLGTVHLPRATIANGEPLAAGTYALRTSDESVKPVAGQGPNSEVWVQFLQAGAVKGQELASVVSPDAVKDVAKEAPPAPGHARVEMLQGNQYLRVWINHAGTNYLVHLAVAGK